MTINWESFENHPFYDELITAKGNARAHARKLISYKRGVIRVLDRSGLEAAACGCYLADKQTYNRILG